MADRRVRFINLIPEFIRVNDINNALEGYLEGVEIEYDKIDDVAIEVKTFPDPDESPCDILPYLASHVGVNLEACDPCELQRIQIKGAVPLYAIKGTRRAYVGFLRSIGFDIGIDELFETSPDGETSLERGPRWDDAAVVWDGPDTWDDQQGGPVWDFGVGVWDGDEQYDVNSSEWDEVITSLLWDTPGLEWDDNQQRFMSSRINLHLDELAEGALTGPCNPTGGLGPEFIRKIKGRIEEATPAHIEIADLNIGKVLIDSVSISDDNDFADIIIDLLDGIPQTFLGCNFYGVFSSPTGGSDPQWDNTPTYAWDLTHTESNGVITPLISWDRFVPELVGDFIRYDFATGAIYSCPETDMLEISTTADISESDWYDPWFYDGLLCSYDGLGGDTYSGDPGKLKDSLEIITVPPGSSICIEG